MSEGQEIPEAVSAATRISQRWTNESAVLRQQLSSLQKENEELKISHQDDIEERTEALIKAVSRAEKAEKEVQVWIHNANELQKQVNGWESERAKLKADLTALREDVRPLLDRGKNHDALIHDFLSKHPELAQS